MDERRLRIRVGIVVFAAVIVSMILVVLFGLKPRFLQPQYVIKVGFPRAPGVTRDTPVRKDGVPIGRVSDVMLRDKGGVTITMRIDRNRPLRMNEYARIGMGSLVTNDAVIEFVREESDPNDQLLADGDYLPSHGAVAGDPLEIMIGIEDDLKSTFAQIQDAGARMSQVFIKAEEQLDKMLDEEQIQRIAASVESALNSFTDVMMAIEEVVGDEELIAEIKNVVKEARPVLAEATQTLDKIQSTADSFRATADSFAGVGDSVQKNLENIEQLTEPLGRKGAQLLATLETTAKNADQLMAQLNTLTKGINSGQGTIGKLVKDDEIHRQVVQTLANIEMLTVKLRPILYDVRTFTDKVAREPSAVTSGILRGTRPGLKTGL